MVPFAAGEPRHTAEPPQPVPGWSLRTPRCPRTCGVGVLRGATRDAPPRLYQREYRVKSDGFLVFLSGFCAAFCFNSFATAPERSYRLPRPRSPGPAAFQDFRSKNGKSGNYRETTGQPPNTPRLPARPGQRCAACGTPRPTPAPLPAPEGWRGGGMESGGMEGLGGKESGGMEG